jgi:hypothetical protein
VGDLHEGLPVRTALDLHARSAVLPRPDLALLDRLQDVPRQLQEGLLDVEPAKGRTLVVPLYVVLLRELPDFFLADLPVGGHVGLVAEETDADVLVRVGFELVEPVPDVPEALEVGEIEDEEHPDGSLVVGAGDGLECFLTGSVPDLQLDFLVVDFEDSGAELNSKGRLVLIFESALDESEQDATLANICIAKCLLVSPIMMNFSRTS